MAPPDSLIAADPDGAEVLRARIRHLTDAAAEARQRADAAEARLRDIEASTAWRITGPARRAAARHPGAAR
ncbi:hypothetical protein, partial [Acidisphaera rubrifaciens]|uniref:hypothetical protein n=1 Tax=Acidisphaera rubrifaciens TaxID=50715 RepID=UPI000662690E